jgi:hypothetical protein
LEPADGYLIWRADFSSSEPAGGSSECALSRALEPPWYWFGLWTSAAGPKFGSRAAIGFAHVESQWRLVAVVSVQGEGFLLDDAPISAPVERETLEAIWTRPHGVRTVGDIAAEVELAISAGNSGG